ncbi:MAG: arsenate reductase (glutaredoxin) [Bacteroidetes bacterium]|nr:MAG: arsenate reductase (glutaredoxin) [Bacteroidota bacterium]
MASITIYHNPRCGKSRQTLQLIQDSGTEPTIIEYLKTPLNKAELTDLIAKLGIPAEQLIRKGESIFKDEFKGKNLSESDWIQAMVDHPILMERPVVVKGTKAVIGRPPELVKELL